jgi:DNA-directed RNA polymerase subunit RPC12/RpoP
MKNLYEYNSERWDDYRKLVDYPKLNGLSCPKCGRELEDIDGNILLSNPPKMNIRCPSCGLRDYRYC